MPGSVAGLTNMLLGGGGQQAPGTQQQQPNAQMYMQQQGQNQQSQAPLDILGLANKAAQALSGIPQQQQPMNPNFPPPVGAPQQTFAHQQNMPSEKDLPMMVQVRI